MRTKFLCLFLLAFAPLLAFGQGVAVSPQTALKSINGVTVPFAGATVTVCAVNTGGIPCSPALVGALFKDIAETQPLSNPFTTDVNGNYSFIIAPGNYTVTVTGAGFNGQSYQLTASSGGSSGPGGSVSIQHNGIAVTTQTILNFLDEPGLGIVFIPQTGGIISAEVTGAIAVSSLTLTLPTDTGTLNAYVACVSVPPPGLTQGLVAIFNASTTNTLPSTFNFCGFGTKNLTKNGSTAISAGDIVAGGTVVLIYDGVEWQDIDPMGSASGSPTFKTNGGLNSSQSGININSQNNVNNYGDFFCTNPFAGDVDCNVGGIIDLGSSLDGAPAGGMLVSVIGPDTGSANNYFSCPAGGMTNTQKAGMQVQFTAANTNTGASTFSMCSQTALAIVKGGGSAIVGGDIVANQVVDLIETGTAWQLKNPSSSASGSFSGQQKGQPTVGLTASTATTEPGTFVAQAFTGTDLCAKITNALNSCPASATAACKVIVNATTPGSIDVCSAGTSNFFSGVSGSIVVDFDLETNIQLKAPVIFPAIAHLVHGIGSSQTVRGTGFIMDPAFADAANNCNFTTGTNGPFPTGHYLCLVIDGGGNWANNAFGGKWRDVYFDCNNVANCVPFYTGNEQEDSYWEHVRVWGNATASATSVSPCGFWDHSVASGGNTGPSHIRIKDSFCDPYGDGIVGSNANNTLYGFVYEGQGSGGDILISGSTVRASGTSNLMQDGVWIDGSTQPNVTDIHCEWMAAECVAFGAGGHATTEAHAISVSDANHSAVGVHFYSGSTGSAQSVIAAGAEVQDDNSSCSTSGSSLDFYTTVDGGQGWWNGGYHVCGSANTDKTGALAFSASTTSATYSFSGTYATNPQCTLTPQASPGTTQFWPTISAGVLTLHATASNSLTVNYHCTGRGN